MQTDSLYIEEKYKEELIREGASPPLPPPSSKAIVQRKPHVFTSEGEHEVLIQKYGAERVEKCYQLLSDWKIDTPKSKWKKSDARSISRWVINALEEKELKDKKKDSTNILSQGSDTVQTNKDWFDSMNRKMHTRFYATHEYVQVRGEREDSEKINFNDPRFKSRLIHELKKRLTAPQLNL